MCVGAALSSVSGADVLHTLSLEDVPDVWVSSDAFRWVVDSSAYSMGLALLAVLGNMYMAPPTAATAIPTLRGVRDMIWWA